MAIQLMNDNNLNVSSEMDAVNYWALGGYAKHYIVKDYKSSLDVTFAGLTATLLGGQACVYGRFVQYLNADGDTITCSLVPGTTQYVVLRIDLSQTAGNEVSFIAVTTLKNENLNNGGLVYDVPLYKISTSQAGVASLNDIRFSNMSSGDYGGVFLKKTNGKGQLVDINHELLTDLDESNNYLEQINAINDKSRKLEAAIKNNTDTFGNVLKMKAGTKVCKCTGNNSVLLFTAAEVKSLVGTSSLGNRTACFVTNGDGAAQVTHVDGTAQLNNNYYAVFDRNVSGLIRINFLLVAF